MFRFSLTITRQLQLITDQLKNSCDAIMVSNIKRNWVHSLGADLLQLCLTRLRETPSKHVTSKQVQTFSKFMTEATVTASDQYVPVAVAANSREAQYVIQQLVCDKNDQQHNQHPHQHCILRNQEINRLQNIIMLLLLPLKDIRNV